ncbi:hypothetical protein HMPREF9554_01486 [Treponema phagedenis F0421]|nr:hypothetical protein HMPREF9554_01486 [Treponema phagedenis F0421]
MPLSPIRFTRCVLKARTIQRQTAKIVKYQLLILLYQQPAV